jgi:hypothetical protein
MQKKIFFLYLAAVGMFAASCDKNDDNSVAEGSKGSFVIVATSSEASYLLQAEDLKSGEITIENNGLETDNGTEWEFNSNKYLYRLQYNQGNAGTSSSYVLNSAGQIEERSIALEIRSRFTTHGSYGKYIVTAAAVATDTKDAAGNAAQGVTFTCIDAEAQTLATKTIIAENFLGNGEYVTFSGIADVNGKLFTAVCPIGVSAYGAANGAGEVRTTTAYPDSVWIAVFDNTNFTSPRIIRDNRLSYATTRFRSQYYTNLAVDDRQNLYVFSCAYESTTTKPSGVLRINSGTETFDPNFFFDIETASGGYKMCKPYYVTGDYFLLQMYTAPGAPVSTSSAPAALRLAIFDAANKTFRWVTGLPAVESIGSLGKKTTTDNGIIYIPVVETENGAQPAIYAINPVTATATKGTVVTCTGIAAVGKLILE